MERKEIDHWTSDELNQLSPAERRELEVLKQQRDEQQTQYEAAQIAKYEMLDQATFDMANQMVDMVQQWAELKILEEQGKVASEAYDNELARIKANFEEEMKKVDADAAQVGEALMLINTAKTPEELRAGLSNLVPGSKKVTDAEVEDFLCGDGIIEI